LIILVITFSFAHMLKARYNLKTNSQSLLAFKKDVFIPDGKSANENPKNLEESFLAIKKDKVIENNLSLLQTFSKGSNSSLKDPKNRKPECVYFSDACDFYSGTVTEYCPTSDENLTTKFSTAKSFITNFTTATNGVVRAWEGANQNSSLNFYISRNSGLEQSPYSTNCYHGRNAPFLTIYFFRNTNLMVLNQWMNTINPRSPVILENTVPQNAESRDHIFFAMTTSSLPSDCSGFGPMRNFVGLKYVLDYDLSNNLIDGGRKNFLNTYPTGIMNQIYFVYPGPNTTITVRGSKQTIVITGPVDGCTFRQIGSIQEITSKFDPLPIVPDDDFNCA